MTIASWLKSLIVTNMYFELATTDAACFCKSNDGSQTMKSEVVTERARTALSWDYRYEAIR